MRDAAVDSAPWSTPSAARPPSRWASRRSCCWSTPARCALAQQRERAVVAARRPPARRDQARRLRGADRARPRRWCARRAEGRETLAALREALRDAGATLHRRRAAPDGAFGDVVHVADARATRRSRASMRGLLGARRPRALHVHVGMPDPETAIDVLQPPARPPAAAAGARRPLAVLARRRLRLRHRARSMLFRGFPRATIPPAFAGWEHYAELVALVAARRRTLPDYTFLWWDIRPSPKPRHGRGARDGRADAGWSRVGRPRRARPRARASPAPTATRRSTPPTEALTESSFRAGRDGARRTVWWRGALRAGARGRRRRARARPALRARPRRRGRARGDRAHPARGRRRGPHARGPRRRRDGRACCARARRGDRTYDSTQTTSPIRSQS